jgi:putative membrane protein
MRALSDTRAAGTDQSSPYADEWKTTMSSLIARLSPMAFRKAALMLLALATLMPAAQAADRPGSSSTPQRGQQSDSEPGASSTNPEGEGVSKSTPGRIGKADRAFVTKAAAGNLYEIEASKLADSRASDPQIKALAQALVRDHSQALAELKSIAASHNYPLPEQLTDDKRAIVQRLKSMSGKEFDQAYRQQVGIRDHGADIKLFERASRATRVPDLKAWIDKTLPTLKSHLKHASTIKAN